MGLSLGSVCGACIDDLGDLSKRPEIPEPPTTRLFTSQEAGVPGEQDASSEGPVPEPTSSAPSTPAPPVSFEPEGRAALTLLHGVVDAETLFFCLRETTEQGFRWSSQPLPAGGLAYGRALVLPLFSPEESANDFSAFAPASDAQALLPVVIAASADELGEQSCADVLEGYGYDVTSSLDVGERRVAIAENRVTTALGLAAPSDAGALTDASVPAMDAGDAASLDAASGDAGEDDAAVGFSLPEIRVAELPEVPLQALGELSYLLVASGCLGVPGLFDEQESLLCGPQFEKSRTSFAGIFTPLSRATGFGALGLQMVNASQAFPSATLRSNPAGGEGVFFTVASTVLLGGIAPSSARRSLSITELGPPDSAQLEVSLPPQSNVLLATPWSEVAATSGVELWDGYAYTLVLIGPAPGTEPGRPWNPPRLSAVRNDPLREPP